MNKPFKYLSVFMLMGTFQTIYAADCVQYNNSLHYLVGIDSAEGSAFAHTASPSNECSCTYARFKTENTDSVVA